MDTDRLRLRPTSTRGGGEIGFLGLVITLVLLFICREGQSWTDGQVEKAWWSMKPSQLLLELIGP